MIYESETVIDIYNYIIILYDFGGYTFNESYLSTTRLGRPWVRTFDPVMTALLLTNYFCKLNLYE